ncbi:MAG: DMT family transporter [Pacificimonas sp.]|jgi:S-adenosylmethionine uptake transporter|nr:DMT family transporter [Pacificimonas sp.]
MNLSPATIFFVAAGIAALSAMDAAIKMVALSDGVMIATWLRYVFGALSLAPFLLILQKPLPDRAGLKAHALRGLLLTATSLTFFYGIAVLPLAEAITLAFVAPLMTPPLAALLIGEKMRARALLAAAIGFVGVVITVSGGSASSARGDYPLAVTAILVSALLYSLQSLILRQRAQKDDAIIVAALATVVPLLILTPLTLTFEPLPSAEAWLPAFIGGALGSIGVLLLVRAYAKAETQQLMVFEYTGLFWAALFGWFLFAEQPRPEVFVGAIVIASSCLLVSREGRRPIPAKKSAF